MQAHNDMKQTESTSNVIEKKDTDGNLIAIANQFLLNEITTCDMTTLHHIYLYL